MTSLENQLRFIRDRGWSNDSLLVAAFCRKYVTTQLLSNDIVDIIVAFFTVMESWNTELKGDHIIVKGTDNDTIEFTKDYSFNSASCAESAYGVQPVSHEGIHQWKVEIMQLKDNGITLIPLAVGLVTGDMNRERKDVNTYFGGFGSKQFELAISRRMLSHGHPKETYLTLRCGNKRINLKQTCGGGDVIGITLDLNEGSVSCTVNDEVIGYDLDGLPKNETYRLAATLTGKGTTLKIVSYEMISNPMSTVSVK